MADPKARVSGPEGADPSCAHELESAIRFSGDVAQLGERLLCKQEVAGSIPVVSKESFDLCSLTTV